MGSLTAITGPSVYLDANVLIYAVEDALDLGQKLHSIFERIDRAEFRGATSELSLAEVLVKPLRDGKFEIVSEFERMLDRAGPLDVIPVSRMVLARAAAVRAKYPSVKLPDAIHAATAMAHGCTTFLTNDARFAAIADLPVLLMSDLP